MKAHERDRLIDAVIEGDIGEADFLRLEAEFTVHVAARRQYYQRLALAVLLEIEAEGHVPADRKIAMRPSPWRRSRLAFAGIAAGLAMMLGILGVLSMLPSKGELALAPVEQKASGFAVLVGQAAAVWKDHSPLADGALIPAGRMWLVSGVAQVELFSGVTLIVEGEVEFEILSPMEMSVTRGKVRARVPEPAHGFRIRTAAGDVVDLGTELALNVDASYSEVHVLDGEVEWQPRSESRRRMESGEALRWGADGKGTALAADATAFVGVTELGLKLAEARQVRQEDWQRFSATLRRDPRLLAYYQMSAADGWNRRVPNEALAGAGAVGEGAIVAAALATDRWGGSGGALDFSPTGSRVRVNVPGEFRSLTFLCWVKIHSLDRWYNSLFLTDGHDLHEPHWQIMDDGRLFFSVKKNDRWDAKKGEKDKHIFYSPPFWHASMSGQWLMLATVYDVEARRVTHYVNGVPLSQEPVPAGYLVEAVSIGAASLGNWGLPERDDSHFAVRNLNGSMDEFALFSAALSVQEIAELYQHGKP